MELIKMLALNFSIAHKLIVDLNTTLSGHKL